MIVHPAAEALPEGICELIDSEQTRLNLYAQHLGVTIPDSSGVIYVSATPPTDHSYVWLKLDTSGRPLRLYRFAAGAWLSLHPLVPGTTIIWTAALPDFTSFDGGDTTGVVADATGPMWEELTTLRFRVPVGAGTLPGGTVLNVGDQGGLEEVTLTAAQLQGHEHVVNTLDRTDASDLWAHFDPAGEVWVTDADKPIAPKSTGGAGYTTMVAKKAGDSTAHTNLQPYTVVFFLRRTSRLFFREI